MKRKSLDEDVCSIARSLDVIGDWWSLLIIRDAMAGKCRFSEFQRNLGVAKNILASRLKALVDQGILEINPASDGSAYLEYTLTQQGRDLLPVLVSLSQWGKTHLFKTDETCSIPLDAKKKRPLEKMQVRSSDGRPLKIEDILMSSLVL